jgi:hypothetical protein
VNKLHYDTFSWQLECSDGAMASRENEIPACTERVLQALSITALQVCSMSGSNLAAKYGKLRRKFEGCKCLLQTGSTALQQRVFLQRTPALCIHQHRKFCVPNRKVHATNARITAHHSSILAAEKSSASARARLAAEAALPASWGASPGATSSLRRLIALQLSEGGLIWTGGSLWELLTMSTEGGWMGATEGGEMGARVEEGQEMAGGAGVDVGHMVVWSAASHVDVMNWEDRTRCCSPLHSAKTIASSALWTADCSTCTMLESSATDKVARSSKEEAEAAEASAAAASAAYAATSAEAAESACVCSAVILEGAHSHGAMYKEHDTLLLLLLLLISHKTPL